MATDILLKLDVEGDSQISGHEGECDILSWSWGATQSGTMHLGGGGGSGKVQVQDAQITKFVDKATPNIWKDCCSGRHIPEIVLTMRKAGEDALDYMVITMTDCLIASVSIGASEGEDQCIDTFGLNFSKFNMVYSPQSQTGGGEGTIEAAWNIKTNTAS